MFNEYPYINLQDINLDFILKHIGELETNLKDFIKINTIKYADPILWNITSQYEANTVTIDGTDGTAYISTIPVPIGVHITNTDYWTPIFNYGASLDALKAQIALHVEKGTTATYAYLKDSLIYWNDELYRSLVDIAIGTAFYANVNVKKTTVDEFVKYITGEEISSLNTTLTEYINGEISDLKDYTDNEISGLKDYTDGQITDLKDYTDGQISDLKDYTDGEIDTIKDYVDDSIEHVTIDFYYSSPEEFGAKGDGETDDTTAINAAFNSGKPVMFGTKTYIISDTINVPARGVAFFNGAIIKRKEGNSVFDMIAVHDYVTLHDGIIDGSAVEDDLAMSEASDRFRGIAVLDCHNVTLSNMTVQNTCSAEAQPEGQKAAIHIMNAYYVTLLNCNVLNNRASGIMFNNGTTHDCKIIGGYSENNMGSGVTGGCHYLEISNFTALNNGYTGISLNGRKNVCANCVSNYNGQGNPWVSGSFSGFTIGHKEIDSPGTKVVNCIAEHNTLDGISVGGSPHISIVGCYLKDNTSRGIYVGPISESSSSSSSTFISDCTLIDNLGDNIGILGNCSANIVNSRLDGPYGITVRNGALKMYDSVISINRPDYSNAYYAIVINNANITLENLRVTSTNSSGTNGRVIMTTTAASVGTINNISYGAFDYLYYEGVACPSISITKAASNKYITNNTGGYLYLNRSTDGLVSFSTSVNNATQVFDIPGEYRLISSAEFISSTGNGTGSYDRTNKQFTATATDRCYITGSWPAEQPDIRRI